MKWTLLFLLFGAALGAAGWSYHTAGPGELPATGFGREDDCTEDIQGIGYVEPISEVRKLMPRAGGIIQRCRVRAGDRVRQGDVLVELEDDTPRAEVEHARRTLEAACAERDEVLSGVNPHRIRVAEKTAARLREKLRHYAVEARRTATLARRGSTSMQDYEQAETLRRQSAVELQEQEAELAHLRAYVTPQMQAAQEAKVRQARSSLALAQERLREYRLTAPLDGKVLKLLKREGDAVSPAASEAVVLLGDLSRLRVRAEINERFVGRLEVGQQARVFGRNLAGRSYRGRLAVVEQIMGDRTVFARTVSERKDLQVLQVLLDMESDFRAPVGLQVDVAIHAAQGCPP